MEALADINLMNILSHSFFSFQPKGQASFAYGMIFFATVFSATYFFNNTILRSAFTDFRWIYMGSVAFVVTLSACWAYKRKFLTFTSAMVISGYLTSILAYTFINGSIHSYVGYTKAGVVFIHLASPIHLLIVLSVLIASIVFRFSLYFRFRQMNSRNQ